MGNPRLPALGKVAVVNKLATGNLAAYSSAADRQAMRNNAKQVASNICISSALCSSVVRIVWKTNAGVVIAVTSVEMNSFGNALPRNAQTLPIPAHTNTGSNTPIT